MQPIAQNWYFYSVRCFWQKFAFLNSNSNLGGHWNSYSSTCTLCYKTTGEWIDSMLSACVNSNLGLALCCSLIIPSLNPGPRHLTPRDSSTPCMTPRLRRLISTRKVSPRKPRAASPRLPWILTRRIITLGIVPRNLKQTGSKQGRRGQSLLLLVLRICVL